MTQGSFPNFGMRDIWETSDVKGGVLCAYHHNLSTLDPISHEYFADIDWLAAETRRKLQGIGNSDPDSPHNEDPHSFSRDSTSLCYVFSNLLLLASPEALDARKDALKLLTTEVLEVLNNITNLYSTKAVNDQMWYSREALQNVQDICREAINQELIAKLCVLWDETFRYSTR